jgi:hypothetical protein
MQGAVAFMLGIVGLGLSDTATIVRRSDIWPSKSVSSISNLGRGAGLVFSPDLATPQTCAVYERLGFRCFVDSSWAAIVRAVAEVNARGGREGISLLILEVHGSGGNGLKLQDGRLPSDGRSYAALGAIEQRFGGARIRYCIVDACNSRRVARASIRDELRLVPDRLVLPATHGVLNATPLSPASRLALLVTRDVSRLEIFTEGSVEDLSPRTRKALGLAGSVSMRFVVSDLLSQLVTDDPELHLQLVTPTETVVRRAKPYNESEQLFQRFVQHLDRLALTAAHS